MINNLTCDVTTSEVLRERVSNWLRERHHVVCAWDLAGFIRLEGMDYWATFVTTLDGLWGIHIYDNGEIQRIS